VGKESKVWVSAHKGNKKAGLGLEQYSGNRSNDAKLPEFVRKKVKNLICPRFNASNFAILCTN
jgi:hypothetical protein